MMMIIMMVWDDPNAVDIPTDLHTYSSSFERPSTSSINAMYLSTYLPTYILTYPRWSCAPAKRPGCLALPYSRDCWHDVACLIDLWLPWWDEGQHARDNRWRCLPRSLDSPFPWSRSIVRPCLCRWVGGYVCMYVCMYVGTCMYDDEEEKEQALLLTWP